MSTNLQVTEKGDTFIPVHLVFWSPQGVISQEGKPPVAGQKYTQKIACTPGLSEFNATVNRPHPWVRTSDARAVTCPACLASAEFRKAADLLRAAGVSFP